MLMMIRFAFTALLLGASAGDVLAAAPSALDAATGALQAAVSGGTLGPVMAARGELVRLSAAEPKSALLHYWVAVADWRAVPLMQNTDKAKALKICESGIVEAERALELDPKFGEALAVKVGLQGMTFSLGGSQDMMTLGPQMEMDMVRARTIAPANPRVLFLDGLNTLHKPGFVGGGPNKALEKLREAIARFEADSAEGVGRPRWGHDDACLWAGRAAMMQKDYATARDYFVQALTINPKNVWVRTSLLPAAEKALADSSAQKG